MINATQSLETGTRDFMNPTGFSTDSRQLKSAAWARARSHHFCRSRSERAQPMIVSAMARSSKGETTMPGGPHGFRGSAIARATGEQRLRFHRLHRFALSGELRPVDRKELNWELRHARPWPESEVPSERENSA
jgi:hypothetical protein